MWNLHSIKNKYFLLKGLIDGREAKTDPFFVDIDVTNRCNIRCVGCQYHSPYITGFSPETTGIQDISFSMVEQLCDELDSNKTSNIILQGAGEPLMHPEIFEMIAMIKRKGFHTVLITNGTLLNRGMIERLLDSGVDTLHVSLWATSTEQYKSNYIGADTNNFNKVKESLCLLSRMKSEKSIPSPQVNIYYAINRANFDTLEQMVLLASEWGCEKVTFSPMADVTNELKEMALTESEIESVKNTLIRLKKQYGDSGFINTVDRTLLRYDLKDELWKHFPCTIAWFHARIRVDGSVQPCGRCDSEVIFGNLHQHSFKEIWNDRQIQNFRYQQLNQVETDFWKDHCACTTCCFVQEMKRIHDVLRWYRHTPIPKGDHLS